MRGLKDDIHISTLDEDDINSYRCNSPYSSCGFSIPLIAGADESRRKDRYKDRQDKEK